METHFAPAERADLDEIHRGIEIISKSEVIRGVMHFVSGLLAVLNEHRQILAINAELLDALGIEDAGSVLGLRPGEALACVHADELPGGCGTSEFCATCGAAVAIVTSLGQEQQVERTCAMTVKRNGEESDLYLRVRSRPIVMDGRRLLLLLLTDITRQQQWTALERTFFHDINNITTGLVGATELLIMDATEPLVQRCNEIRQIAMRLAREVEIQRCLAHADVAKPSFASQDVSVHEALDEVLALFSVHPAARERRVHLVEPGAGTRVETDRSLLVRILSNMVVNALEATEPGDEIRVWTEQDGYGVDFCVWNRAFIPQGVARRIFQRNFTTKSDEGRGLGTYSMKLFGERFLGGAVSFDSSEREGTVFRFGLPASPAEVS